MIVIKRRGTGEIRECAFVFGDLEQNDGLYYYALQDNEDVQGVNSPFIKTGKSELITRHHVWCQLVLDNEWIDISKGNREGM